LRFSDAGLFLEFYKLVLTALRLEYILDFAFGPSRANNDLAPCVYKPVEQFLYGRRHISTIENSNCAALNRQDGNKVELSPKRLKVNWFRSRVSQQLLVEKMQS